MRRFMILGLCVATLLTACASEAELNRRAGIRVEQSDKDVRVILPNSVLFRVDEAKILPEADAALKRSIVLLSRTKMPVLVEGHTDNQGTLEYNQTLSEDRAIVVGKRLEQLGFDTSRMTTKGYSFTKPVATNDTPEGRQANRRTDIVILNESLDVIMGK